MATLVSLQHLFNVPLQPPHTYPAAASTSSRKPWTDEFPLDSWTYHNPTLTALHHHFGGPEAIDGLRTASLDNQNQYLLDPLESHLFTKADVVSYFDENFILPMKKAFREFPPLAFLCQTPPPLEQHRVVIDWSIMHRPAGKRPNFAVIGECKRPGTIRQQDWRNLSAESSSTTESLAQELQGHAYHYNCLHVFCYDGDHLLLLRWPCNTDDRRDILTTKPDCWVLATAAGGQGGLATCQYALYQFCKQGYQSVQAKLSPRRTAVQGGASLSYQLFSGRPIWIHDATNVTTFDHPSGQVTRWFDEDEKSHCWLYQDRIIHRELPISD